MNDQLNKEGEKQREGEGRGDRGQKKNSLRWTGHPEVSPFKLGTVEQICLLGQVAQTPCLWTKGQMAQIKAEKSPVGHLPSQSSLRSPWTTSSCSILHLGLCRQFLSCRLSSANSPSFLGHEQRNPPLAPFLPPPTAVP